MKKKVGIVVGLWLVGAVLIGSGVLNPVIYLENQGEAFTVQAGKESSSDDIQKKIDEVNRQKESVEEEKEQLEKDIAEIETKKSNVLEYVESLDNKMQELSEKMEQNELNIVSVKQQIKKLRREKRQAEADKENQYDTMKKRIKYMYENGSEGYLELLLGADSLSELFNRAEYVNRVTSYDNNMLFNYQKLCSKIEKSQRKLEQNLEQLEQLKESLELEKDSVDILMERKTEELKKYQTLISDKSSEVEAKDDMLQEQEDELEALLAAQRKKVEQEAKEKEEEKKKEEKKKEEEKQPSNNSSDNTSNNTSNNTTPKPSASPNQTEGGYQWPLAVSGRISSYFGYRDAPTAGASTFHKGIDIAVPVGTCVLATKAGTVVTATYSASAGNYIALYHGNGVYSYYMHCSVLSVGVGTQVSKGQQIALSGNTGISTGPHLHFAIYANGAYVNPLNYVSQ